VLRVDLALLAFHHRNITFAFHLKGHRDFREIFEIGEATDDSERSKDAAFKLAVER